MKSMIHKITLAQSLTLHKFDDFAHLPLLMLVKKGNQCLQLQIISFGLLCGFFFYMLRVKESESL